MYHWLVASKTRELFEKLSEADAGPFLATVADDVVFTYPGRHAMAGTVHGKEALREWFARFHRLYPQNRLILTPRNGNMRTNATATGGASTPVMT